MSNFYINGGCRNKDWNPEPSDEWGTVGGTHNQSCSTLPVVAIQRKDVSLYAAEQIGEHDAVYSINFTPRGSRENADARIREIEIETLRELFD